MLRDLSNALPAERIATSDDLPVVSPIGDAEWRAALAVANAHGSKVVVRGADSRAGERPWPQGVQLVLSTAGDDALVQYEPGDGVVSARAGMPLDTLRASVAAGRHHLVPLLPRGAGTIGGAVAAGRSGADRLRFGPLRHHVLGIKLLQADGEIVRSGGALVKNVTGYALHRLWTGSHGAFGAVLEVHLRLFPLAARTEIAVATLASLQAALDLGRKLAGAPAAPLAVEVRGRDERWELSVVHAATPRVLATAWDEARRIAPELSTPREAGEWVAEPDAPALLHLTAMPSRLFEHLSALRRLAGGALGEALVRPGIGEALVAVDGANGGAAALERELASSPLDARWRRAPADVLTASLGRETRAPGFALMRRLRERYDRPGRFAPGRFFGGL